MRAQGHPFLWTLLSFAIVFVAWELTVRLFALPEYLLPGPEPVLAALVQNIRTLAVQSLWTAGTVLAGFLVAAAVAIPLAMLIVISPVLERLLYPPMVATQSIPKIALAPLFIVWLGLGMASKVAVVVLATFFLVFFNTYSGLLNVNEELLRLARLMGASWHHCIFRVVLPSAGDQIFIGLKTAVPYAVIGAVIGEYIGSNAGLGHFILYASQTYDAPALFSGIAALIVIVFVCNFTLNALERRLIRWRHIEGATVQL